MAVDGPEPGPCGLGWAARACAQPGAAGAPGIPAVAWVIVGRRPERHPRRRGGGRDDQASIVLLSVRWGLDCQRTRRRAYWSPTGAGTSGLPAVPFAGQGSRLIRSLSKGQIHLPMCERLVKNTSKGAPVPSPAP